MIEIPVSPFPVSGLIYDTDGSTPLEDVTVQAYDETNNSSISSPPTSNSVGEYIVDLANLSSDYSQGDKICIEAYKETTYGNSTITKIKQHYFTLSGSSYETDLTLTYFDSLDLIVAILNEEWQKSRTENQTPLIAKIFDYKRVDLQNNKAVILCYELPTIPSKISVGTSVVRLIFPVSIDIRSMRTRLFTEKVRNEVWRILNSKILNPADGFHFCDPDRTWTDLSDRSIGLWRYIMQTEFDKLGVSRTESW